MPIKTFRLIRLPVDRPLSSSNCGEVEICKDNESDATTAAELLYSNERSLSFLAVVPDGGRPYLSESVGNLHVKEVQ